MVRLSWVFLSGFAVLGALSGKAATREELAEIRRMLDALESSE